MYSIYLWLSGWDRGILVAFESSLSGTNGGRRIVVDRVGHQDEAQQKERLKANDSKGRRVDELLQPKFRIFLQGKSSGVG